MHGEPDRRFAGLLDVASGRGPALLFPPVMAGWFFLRQSAYQIFELDPQRLDRVGDTYQKHRLLRITQQVDDLLRIRFEIDTLPVQQKMKLVRATDQVGKARVQLGAEEAQNSSDLDQRDSSAAQLFDDKNIDQIGGGVQAVAPLARWNHDATLVPPLELTRGSAGQLHNLARAEGFFRQA